MRRELTQEDLELARLPLELWGASISKSTIQEPSLSRLRRYGENIGRAKEDGIGLYLCGPNGVGKSSAAAAILKEAMRHGYGGLWLTAQRLIDARLRDEIYYGEMTLFRRAETVDFLVVDDLGKEHRGDSGYVHRVIDQIVRHRRGELLPTIFTANIEAERLGELYKMSTVEAMRGKIKSWVCEGPNRRAA